MPRRSPTRHLPTARPPRDIHPAADNLSNSANPSQPDNESDEPWDDDESEEEIEPLDDSDLEIEEEPEPDEGDFWIDPDEGEDPWN